jgi:hypothetical protein
VYLQDSSSYPGDQSDVSILIHLENRIIDWLQQKSYNAFHSTASSTTNPILLTLFQIKKRLNLH